LTIHCFLDQERTIQEFTDIFRFDFRANVDVGGYTTQIQTRRDQPSLIRSPVVVVSSFAGVIGR
jgi:hypothetical protein